MQIPSHRVTPIGQTTFEHPREVILEAQRRCYPNSRTKPVNESRTNSPYYLVMLDSKVIWFYEIAPVALIADLRRHVPYGENNNGLLKFTKAEGHARVTPRGAKVEDPTWSPEGHPPKQNGKGGWSVPLSIFDGASDCTCIQRTDARMRRSANKVDSFNSRCLEAAHDDCCCFWNVDCRCCSTLLFGGR